jgi:O-antigen ligase
MSKLAYAALWTFVFLVPADPVFAGYTSIVPSKIAGALAFGLALLAFVTSGRLRRWHPFHVAALLFVIWVGCGLAFIYNTWITIPNKFLTYVQLVLVVWMIWEIAATRGRQVGLLAAYVVGAYVAAIETIMIYRQQANVLRRFSAGGVDGNDLAMTLALAIPMAWYLAMTYRQPLRRWLCISYLPFGVFAIGLTGSRGGMITTIVALLIVPLTVGSLTLTRRAVGIALLCISGVVAVTYVPETLIERLATTRSELEEGRLGGRWKLWNAGLKAFTVRPLVGYGPAGFKRAVDPWLLQRSQVAHNSFLSVLVEQGMVGLFLYLMMFFSVGMAVLKLPPLERRFALVLLVALAVSMMPLTSEDSRRVWFILGTLVALSQTSAVRTGGAAWKLRGRQLAPRARPLTGGRPREPLTVPVRNTNRGTTE